jgi:hypothetical protein
MSPNHFSATGIVDTGAAHDPNAVILRVHGYAIGYVAQEFASSVKGQIGSGVKVGCKLLWNRDPEAPMISVVITSVD